MDYPSFVADNESTDSADDGSKLARKTLAKEAFRSLDPHTVRFTQTLLRLVEREQGSLKVMHRKPFVHFCYVQTALVCKVREELLPDGAFEPVFVRMTRFKGHVDRIFLCNILFSRT